MKASATFADVRVRLQSGETLLTSSRREDVIEALDVLARLSDTALRAIPADRRTVRKLINANSNWQTRFASQDAFDKWVDDLVDAIKCCPIASNPCRFGTAADLSPAWKAIDDSILGAVGRGEISAWAHASVRYIFNFANTLDIPPSEFDNTAYQMLLRHHKEIDRDSDSDRRRRRVPPGINAGRAWNRFVQLRHDKPCLAFFPSALVSWKGQKSKRNIQVVEMAPALQVEIANYVSWMRHDSSASTRGCLNVLNDSVSLPPKAERDPRPYAEETIKQVLSVVRLSVTAAVEIGGQSLDSIVSLRQITGVTALGRAMGLLEYRLQRDGRDLDTTTRSCMAERLVALSRYLNLSDDTIKKMRDLISQELGSSTGDKRRISVSRRRKLRQFDERSKADAWFDGPRKFFEGAERLREYGSITPSSISDVEVAIATKFIQSAALTRGDLVCLRHKGTDPTLILQDEASRISLLVLGHNILPVEFDEETMVMLGAYLVYYRPAWLKFQNAMDSDFLFPGKSPTGSRYAAGLATMFRNRWRERGLELTPHIGRHLAAKNMIAEGRNHPSTVAALLGVGEDVVTRSFVEGETDSAFRTYQTALLETAAPKERALLDRLVANYRSGRR